MGLGRVPRSLQVFDREVGGTFLALHYPGQEKAFATPDLEKACAWKPAEQGREVFEELWGPSLVLPDVAVPAIDRVVGSGNARGRPESGIARQQDRNAVPNTVLRAAGRAREVEEQGLAVRAHVHGRGEPDFFD